MPPASSPSPPFAHAHNTTAFLPVCKQAIARRGLPMRRFVDNGANDRSQPLALVCAKLGIALIHARPYQPAGKGNIERFFRTFRAAVLAHLTAEATESLHTLNRTVWAWVEGEYPLSPPPRTRRAYPPRPVGPSQATTCALPTPAQTSTTSSSSRPNAA